jgi:predicted tellurium resistance membrane protein TerC
VDSHHVDAVTGRDLILFFGGIFLMIKAILEIHKKMMGGEEEEISESARSAKSFGSIIAQIIVLDIVFSLDSVISAVGMVQEVWIMVVAMVVAVAFMAVFAGRISSFIERNPTFKMLALSFLVMIGVVLIAEGLGTHIGKGYIYGSMFFALLVELLNMRARRKKDAKKGVVATGTGARLSQPPPASA